MKKGIIGTQHGKRVFWIATIFKTLFATFLFLIPPMEGRSQTETYTWGNVALGGGGFVTGIISHKTSGDVYCRTDVGGAYRWDAANSKWIPLLDWNSEDETTYQGIEALALDPQNANNLYLLAGTDYFNNGKTAILKSTDKGNTFSVVEVTSQFKAHGNGLGRSNGERLAVDPNNSNVLFCGTRAKGLWKSTDGGSSWTLAWNGVTTTTNGNGICFVVFDPSSVSGGVSQTIYIGVSRTGGDNIYKSTDGGSTFTAIQPDNSFMPHRAVLSSDNSTLYVVMANSEGPSNGDSGRVYKLATATGTWTNITPGGNNYPYGGVSVDPANKNRIVVSTVNVWTNNQFGNTWGDFIFLSTDGGSTWTSKLTPTSAQNTNGIGWIAGRGIHWAGSIDFDPLHTARVRVMSGNGLFTCDDINASTTSWKFDVKGMEETVVLDAISIPGGNFVSAVGDQFGASYSDIYAYPTKVHTPTVVTNNGIAYAANNRNKVVRVSDKIYYSSDQGVTWPQSASINGSYGKVALSADGNTTLHCPGGSSTTYYSTNNGGTWTSTGVTNVQDACPIADYVNTNKFYIYSPGSGQLLVSTDKGVSFTASSSNPGSGGSVRARAVPGNEGHVWVALAYGLKYTTNNGTSWTTVSNVTYCKAVGFGKAATGATYPAVYIWGTVSGVKGMFRSTDQGASWIRINDDAHEWGGVGNGNFIMGDMNVYGRAYMCTVGRGLLAGEAPKYTLTTTASPSAGGTVTGAGSYTAGSTATPTATPAAGYTFTGWSGDATGTSASVAVAMTKNKSVTANFLATNYTLVTTASPAAGGTVSGAGSYAAGSTPTLTATPAAGYTFTGWSGDASGTGSSTTVTMNSNKSVTANFQVIKYTLTTTASPVGGGTVSGAGSYDAGSAALLTATPAAGYTFTGWSGDATGTASSVTITMSGNKTVTANFQAQSSTTKYTLTTIASPSAGGSISGAGTYDAGSVAALTATPAAGYTFIGWSGDATGTASSMTITMSSNKTVTANFQAQPSTAKYTLATTASPSEGGSISGAGTYDAGSVAALTATPAAGYTFTGWSGDVTGTSTSTTVVMNSNKSVTANFAIAEFTIIATVVPAAGGSVTGAGKYPSGTTVIIEAIAATGYTFSGWSGDIAGTATSQTVTVSNDMVVQANFENTEAVALKIPKLFSPDNRGDISTEAWNIENAYLLDGCEMVIYNRQGQKVYSTVGYATPWDGTSNGRPLPDGAYFYIIRYPDNKKQTGSVTIARLK